jgi:CheY-like chemotaxis protein
LEQVLLNILLYAERSIAESGRSEAVVTISTSVLGHRALVDFDFPIADEMQDPFAADPEEGSEGGLALLRGIIQSHGGEIRFETLRKVATEARIEVELPRAQQQPDAARESEGAPSRRAVAMHHPSLRMTVLVIEPDLVSQRNFVSWMARRGHRVIPVRSPDEAFDLVQRVKCDMVACASRMPGFHWHAFYEKVRANTDAFVLLLDSNSVGHAFAAGEGYVLRKPLYEAEFDQVMDAVTAQLGPPFAQAG